MARMISRMTGKDIFQKGRSVPPAARTISPEQRQHMIGEAAYYRYVHRGYAPGHDLDDWLEAEADFDQGSAGQQTAEPADQPRFPTQQSGTFGAAEDDILKRSIKQHPRRDISRIESIDPEEAPLKE